MTANLQPIVVGVIVIILTYVFFREAKRFFLWLRASKKIPTQLLDAIEPLIRNLINFRGILLFLLDISTIFGLQDLALAIVPNVITAVVILVVTWISLQITKQTFTLLKERRKIP